MIEARQEQGIINHDFKTNLNLRKLSYKIKSGCKKLYLEFKGQIKQKFMLKHLPITKPTLSKLKDKDRLINPIIDNPFVSIIKDHISELSLTPTVSKNVGKSFLSIPKLLISLRKNEIPTSYYVINQIFIENNITKTLKKPKKYNPNNTNLLKNQISQIWLKSIKKKKQFQLLILMELC